jgi:hypothetical protein
MFNKSVGQFATDHSQNRLEKVFWGPSIGNRESKENFGASLKNLFFRNLGTGRIVGKEGKSGRIFFLSGIFTRK